MISAFVGAIFGVLVSMIGVYTYFAHVLIPQLGKLYEQFHPTGPFVTAPLTVVPSTPTPTPMELELGKVSFRHMQALRKKCGCEFCTVLIMPAELELES